MNADKIKLQTEKRLTFLVKTRSDSFSFAASPFSMREKVAEGRMRGGGAMKLQYFPITLTLSLMAIHVPQIMLDTVRGIVYKLLHENIWSDIY
jgi:hypothetical protein